MVKVLFLFPFSFFLFVFVLFFLILSIAILFINREWVEIIRTRQIHLATLRQAAYRSFHLYRTIRIRNIRRYIWTLRKCMLTLSGNMHIYFLPCKLSFTMNSICTLYHNIIREGIITLEMNSQPNITFYLHFRLDLRLFTFLWHFFFSFTLQFILLLLFEFAKTIKYAIIDFDRKIHY